MSSHSVGVVLLAAGYGTRLARDMRGDPAFVALATTPKPLLPVGGRILLDHWLTALVGVPNLSTVVVVTNSAHEPLYTAWAAAAGNKSYTIKVTSDGSSTNCNRLGAIADMQIGIDSLPEGTDIGVIIAGDTLLPGVDMKSFLSEFSNSGGDLAVFAYKLADMSDCVRRGMLMFGEGNESRRVVGMVEKPRSPELAPSNCATAPVYILRRTAFSSIPEFLEESVRDNIGLEKRDAPGFWLGWVVTRLHCVVLHIDTRVDIGGLAHYKQALVDYNGIYSQSTVAPLLNEPAVGRALPRVGILGNPSDGYGGKCIAAAIDSEGYAEVVVTPSPVDDAEAFVVVPNPDLEMPASFSSAAACAAYIGDRGIHYGARQLVLAGLSAFVDAYRLSTSVEGASTKLDSLRCKISYSTTIPARLGLSGSSAFILATIRALCRFYGTTMGGINADIATWPQRVLNAETELLGIAGGLMDRVAQVYEGCVFIDFAIKGKPIIKPIAPSLFPAMWLAYAKGGKIGEHSGKVHGNLRKQYQAGDKVVLSTLKQLAAVASDGQVLLEEASTEAPAKLSELVAENFSLRVKLMGGLDDMAVESLQLVKTADEAGLSGKMSGSGGAALCVSKSDSLLSPEEEEDAVRIFDAAGFVLRPVAFATPVVWR
jgi:glucuronokinase